MTGVSDTNTTIYQLQVKLSPIHYMSSKRLLLTTILLHFEKLQKNKHTSVIHH